MIPITVYAESGGAHKTTMAANLAVAFQRAGLKTLIIDLDAQEGNISFLFDAKENTSDPEADNIVRHMLGKPRGDFSDIIHTTDEGPDIIPAHDMLENFNTNLENKINYLETMGEADEFNRYSLLYDLLWDTEEVQNEYDVVIADPNARAEDQLYNAIYATRTIVAPVQPAGKGGQSLNGLESVINALEKQHGIDIGVAAIVPSGVGNTNANRAYRRKFEQEKGWNVPVAIGNRGSMMDAMWDAKGSAFKVVEEQWKSGTNEGGDPVGLKGERGYRKREVKTLVKLYELAHDIANTFDVDLDPEVEIHVEGNDPETFKVAPEVSFI